MITDTNGKPITSEKPPEPPPEDAANNVSEEELEEGMVDVRLVSSGMLYFNMFRQLIVMDRMEMIMGQMKMQMHHEKAIVPPPEYAQVEEQHVVLTHTVKRMVDEIDQRCKDIDVRRATLVEDEKEAAKK